VEPGVGSRPANAEDAHRGLDPEHDLAAILSHIELREVLNNYNSALRRMALVQYLRIRRCAEAVKAVVLSPAAELRPLYLAKRTFLLSLDRGLSATGV
jgi:hypothetical protein